MNLNKAIRVAGVLACMIGALVTVRAQGTLDDYRRAQRFVGRRDEGAGIQRGSIAAVD